MTETSAAIVYQLKVALVGISPMIWRRLQVNGESTISDLHYIGGGPDSVLSRHIS